MLATEIASHLVHLQIFTPECEPTMEYPCLVKDAYVGEFFGTISLMVCGGRFEVLP